MEYIIKYKDSKRAMQVLSTIYQNLLDIDIEDLWERCEKYAKEHDTNLHGFELHDTKGTQHTIIISDINL